MINFRKKHIKKIAFILITIFVISLLPPIKAKAASINLSTSSLSIQAGKSASFAIQPNGAAGRVNISTDGPISVSSSSEWIEGGSTSVTVYGNSAGNGHVYVYLYNVGATDGSGNLDDITLTINVSVYNAQNNNNNNNNNNSKNKSSNNTGNDDVEENEGLTEEIPVLNVNINEVEYTILTDLTEITLPVGFTLSEGNYGIEKVPVAKYISKEKEEIVLYALTPVEGGDIIFMTFNSSKAEFGQPKTIKQNDNTYYILNLPKDVKLPDTYKTAEVTIGSINVNAITAKDKNNSEFVYIYALFNGNEGYYSYDTVEGTIQRCSNLEERIFPKVEVVEETKNSVNKTMVIIIGIAAVAVLVMGIFLIILIAKRKKDERTVENEEDEEEVLDDVDEFNEVDESENKVDTDDSVDIDVIDLSEDTEDLEEDDGLDLIDLSKK